MSAFGLCSRNLCAKAFILRLKNSASQSVRDRTPYLLHASVSYGHSRVEGDGNGIASKSATCPLPLCILSSPPHLGFRARLPMLNPAASQSACIAFHVGLFQSGLIWHSSKKFIIEMVSTL